MADYGILAQKQGAANHMPSILMSEAFINTESRNVHEYNGVYRSFHKQSGVLIDDDGEAFVAPTAVYAITGVNTGTGVFTIAGNHASEVGSTIRINGSTGNDQVYTVTDASDVAADTEVTVSETISDATVDGNLHVGATQILRYHLYKNAATGNEYLLLATAYHILLWNESAKTLTVKFTCGTPASVEGWSIITHRGDVYATNNVDLVQVWDADSSPGSAFGDCDTASGLDLGGGSYCTKAKFLGSFEGFLFAANITIDSTAYPQNAIWDDGTGADTFDTGDAGEKAMVSNPYPINGLGILGHEMVFFRTEGRAVIAYLNTDSTVFSWYDTQQSLGCVAPESIVNVKSGDLYYLADDLTFRSKLTGQAVMPQISSLLRKMNRKYAGGVAAAFMGDEDTILVAIPYLDATENDLLIEYRIDDQQVYLHDISVVNFGGWYGQATPTYTSIGKQYATYNEWGAAWATYNQDLAREGSKLILVSDSSGNSYELRPGSYDSGSSQTASLVFDTTMGDWNQYKRLNGGMELLINRASAGTVTVKVKRDGEAGYSLVGSGSYADAAAPEYVRVWISTDIRAKHFRFKIESDSYIEIISVIFRRFRAVDGVR